ncbi:cysteine desulfurase CsdA [Vibrio parahaemolyticus]|uniref:cysteine desulfurase CsdA n=1 Tax=Vibrio parahaemolyticus TaxID=670 RepID=UPI0005B71813|nr:cysteine desulfurase CsdA [Vibrio parahaemolyticus]KIT49355.1 cysteine sulfinate desulfinase [Vibrio parahaemolyticus 901128]EGQ8258314.1 cysteine desulfurase CsdA [Vibrio parahaemolyticus]EGQ8797132.1 cysteine desulfurase CsdA [Vibrio parahaemolyticus]EGQ8840374.1 cysteine desulfurase CsdA [Vibrio parahaemolyticus]EGQ9508241.1 cysteine desulfurase CsdA [Vibrio parahaemolyticus]
MFDVNAVREQFPALNQDVNQAPLVYLDSAATTQKPQCVIDVISRYYSAQNANVHRGSHSLTANATSQFEAAREAVATFIGANSSKEIIWTRGATEALNLIAQTYARSTLQPGDEILISEMEHHANIVPWQIVAEQTGAKIIKVPMTAECQFDLQAFEQKLSERCKIVACAQITNVTGTRQPIEKITELAHSVGAVVVVDGAQGIVHDQLDLSASDIDFYVFSGHKLYAPAGIGVLYGKLELLEAMPPWHGGGKMVERVSFEKTTFSALPGKFEAGTPNVAGAIALAKAIEWYQGFDHHEVEDHLHVLQDKAYRALNALDDIHILGYQPNASVLTFVMDGVHHQDMATLLDQQGIAVRAGHHCAHPLMDALNVKGTVRVSFGIYNTAEDVDRLIAAVEKAADML